MEDRPFKAIRPESAKKGGKVFEQRQVVEYACDVPGCDNKISSAVKVLRDGEFVKFNSVPCTWEAFHGLLICDRHAISVLVDGKVFLDKKAQEDGGR